MTRKNSAVRARRSPVRKFNPGTLQSDQEVVDQFVVRNRELDTVLEILHGNIESPSCQHVLIVAPRGRGKTMLLARAAAELRTKDKFSRFLLPVRFMEESHEIFDVADFWLETLFHLARESATSHPELAQELRETHADLSGRWRERTLGDHARAVVLNAAERIDRKLVLMVENLQTLCGSVDDDFGWQLRAALQSEPQIMMLASATSRFEGLEDAEEPFFELFRVMDLTPLTTEECRRLWQTVSGDQVSARDVRPLEILTGGNPRLLVVVASFSEHRSLHALMEELVRLIDEHTEYFRGHLEVLPKSERRVYIAIIDLWQPSSTGEIAERARMDVRVVSTMLGRLVQRGAVKAQSAVSSRRRLYTAVEPLYSIYYKLRRERDEAAVVESLIRFMLAFYGSFMLYGIFDRLWSEASDVPAVLSGIDRVLEKRPLKQGLRSEMDWDRLDRVSKKAWNHRRMKAEKRLDDEIEAAFEEKAYERVIELVDRYVAAGWNVCSGASPEHQAAFLAHLRCDAYFGMGEYSKVVSIADEVIERFRDSRDVFILNRSSWVLYRKVLAHFELGDYRETVASAGKLVDWFGNRMNPVSQKIVAWALKTAAEAQEKCGNAEAAISLLDEILEGYGQSETPEVQTAVVAALLGKANIVASHMKDDEGAIAIYNDVIERYGKSELSAFKSSVYSALINRAFSKGRLGDFEGEIASYDSLIERAGANETAGGCLGMAFAFKAMRLAEIGRTEEALIASGELERRAAPSGEDWSVFLAWMGMEARAIALMVQRNPAAIDAFRAAYALFNAGNKVTSRVMIRVVLNLVAVGAREGELATVLDSDKAKSGAIAPLVVALRERAGESIRAPAEVLEVASDIKKTLEEKSVKGVLTAY